MILVEKGWDGEKKVKIYIFFCILWEGETYSSSYKLAHFQMLKIEQGMDTREFIIKSINKH